jgi:small nuclear ribonucleoprotein (snRNP)-like protein|tara:strand:+ start:7499 stop:7888 length:390 start_codon:yes stop_codon:yes gene_type:complete
MPVPVGLGPREGLQEPHPDPPEVAAVRAMLNRRLRVRVTDNRVFIGYLHCFDKVGNVLLYNSVERGGLDDKERHVGYILITPETVVETHLHNGESAGVPAEGVAPEDAIDGLLHLSLMDNIPPTVDLVI